MNADDVPAWFGKIAGLGDFANRRLSRDAAQALDGWLAQGIAASRAQLGERWLNVYLTSPLWRFAWAPGLLDASWWFGVMMPSVDNVGRYFPLVVLQARAAPPISAQALSQLEDWYDAAADVALQTLQPGASLDQFEAALAQLAQGTPLPAEGVVTALGAAQWPERSRYEIADGASLAQWLPALAVSDTVRRFQGCSLWWPLRPGVQDSSASIAVGLPGQDSFARLLEGIW